MFNGRRGDVLSGVLAALTCFLLLFIGSFVGAHLVLGPLLILAGSSMLPRKGRGRWIGGGLLTGVVLLVVVVAIAGSA